MSKLKVSEEKETSSQSKIEKMEENIVDLNKNLCLANTCARNAAKEVKRLRLVTNETKQYIQKVLPKDV